MTKVPKVPKIVEYGGFWSRGVMETTTPGTFSIFNNLAAKIIPEQIYRMR